jgi:hypothetical protein
MNQSLDNLVPLDIVDLKLYQCNELDAFRQSARDGLSKYRTQVANLSSSCTHKLKSIKVSGWLLLVGAVCAFIGVGNFLHQESSDQVATVLAVLSTVAGTVLLVRDCVDLIKEKGAMELTLNQTNALREFLRRCEIAKWQKRCP